MRVNPSLPPGGITAEIDGFVTFVGVTSPQRTSMSRDGLAVLPLFDPTACAVIV